MPGFDRSPFLPPPPPCRTLAEDLELLAQRLLPAQCDDVTVRNTALILMRKLRAADLHGQVVVTPRPYLPEAWTPAEEGLPWRFRAGSQFDVTVVIGAGPRALCLLQREFSAQRGCDVFRASSGTLLVRVAEISRDRGTTCAVLHIGTAQRPDALKEVAILQACKAIPHVQPLVTLVRHWAAARGLLQWAAETKELASAWSLSSYAWTLLTLYYLQLERSAGTPSLPPVECWQGSSATHFLACLSQSQPDRRASLRDRASPPLSPGPQPDCGGSSGSTTASSNASEAGSDSGARASSSAKDGCSTAVALFSGFLRFYGRDFDWQRETVSLRWGRRYCPPDLELLLTLALGDASTSTGPIVEDPFQPCESVSSALGAAGLAATRAELRRGAELLEDGAGLEELFSGR